MEYSREAIDGAVNGIRHLRNQVRTLRDDAGDRDGRIDDGLQRKFLTAINDDLNMPRALAVVQELLKSDLAPEDRLATVFDFDRVLGFDLRQADKAAALPEAIEQMIAERTKARAARDFARSDELRDAIEAQGYAVQDTPEGMKVFKP
jgi:cysteinyl-tRNA synthetase